MGKAGNMEYTDAKFRTNEKTLQVFIVCTIHISRRITNVSWGHSEVFEVRCQL